MGSVAARDLVVEDEPLVARTYPGMLADHGVAVIVTTLAAARHALQTGGPWAGFLVDVRLPDGSGLSLLPAIRGNYPDVPVLVVSGAIDDAVANAAFENGAACVGKPLTEERLRKFLADWAPKGSGRVERTLAMWGRRCSLSGMEMAVLRVAADGCLTRAEIALELGGINGLSELTVKTHVQRLLAKTGFATLAAAAIALVLEALDGEPRT